MHHRTATFILAILLACCVDVSAAQASLYCDVVTPRAGFAALRSAPNRDAPMVARLRRGDEVQPRDDIAARGDWIYVVWWKGGRFKTPGRVGYDPPSGKGWMLKQFIADVCG